MPGFIWARSTTRARRRPARRSSGWTGRTGVRLRDARHAVDVPRSGDARPDSGRAEDLRRRGHGPVDGRRRGHRDAPSGRRAPPSQPDDPAGDGRHPGARRRSTWPPRPPTNASPSRPTATRSPTPSPRPSRRPGAGGDRHAGDVHRADHRRHQVRHRAERHRLEGITSTAYVVTSTARGCTTRSPCATPSPRAVTRRGRRVPGRGQGALTHGARSRRRDRAPAGPEPRPRPSPKR